MKKYISYEKMSKKARKEIDADKRERWQISPVTRTCKKPKAYDRAKEKQMHRDI